MEKMRKKYQRKQSLFWQSRIHHQVFHSGTNTIMHLHFLYFGFCLGHNLKQPQDCSKQRCLVTTQNSQGTAQLWPDYLPSLHNPSQGYKMCRHRTILAALHLLQTCKIFLIIYFQSMPYKIASSYKLIQRTVM